MEGSMPHPLPEFLGIGVQKGGTTTLQRLLERHPQVWLPPEKEVHFFSRHYARGCQWYADRFAAARPDQHCGEITPYYVFHPQAARRIAALLPQVRLIVLLRDPVERCLSQYFHACRHGFEMLPLEAALAAEQERLAGADAVLSDPAGAHRRHQENSYFARSCYGEQLDRYEQIFAREQLLVLRSEDLFDDGANVWQRVQQFLELDAIPFPQSVKPANAGQGEAAAVPARLKQQLRAQLAPTYRAMQERYGIGW